MRLQTALIYDSVILISDTFKQLGLEQIQPTNVFCMGGNESMWEKGLSITNFMLSVCENIFFCSNLYCLSINLLLLIFVFLLQTTISGVTGDVKFAENGRRSDLTLSIHDLNTQGLTKVATWNPELGIKPTEEKAAGEGALQEISLKNMTFVVLTSLVRRILSLNFLCI